MLNMHDHSIQTPTSNHQLKSANAVIEGACEVVI